MKILLNLIVSGLVVFLLARFLPGVHVSSFWSAIGVAVVLSLLNTFIKPILVFFTLPATFITLGLFLFVINAVIIILCSNLMPSYFSVENFWWALLFSILLSVFQSIADALFGTNTAD